MRNTKQFEVKNLFQREFATSLHTSSPFKYKINSYIIHTNYSLVLEGKGHNH